MFFQYDYALRHLFALVNLCENKIETHRILQSIYHVCAWNLPEVGWCRVNRKLLSSIPEITIAYLTFINIFNFQQLQMRDVITLINPMI